MKHKKWKILVSIISVMFICLFSFFCVWRYDNRDYTEILAKQKETTKEPVTTLNIATYNVKLLDEGSALDKFVEDIKGKDLDIIGLQEVDQNADRSNNLDMVKEMADAAGYPYYYFFKSMWVFDGSYGLGILSKYPILDVTSYELPNGTFSEPRILSNTTIDVNGEIFHVYNTHLTYFNRAIRDRQIDFIIDKISGQKNTIFMGDMNSFDVESIFSIDGFSSLNTRDKNYITFRDVGYPDNIYFSNDITIGDIHVDKTSFSDHNLFWSTIHLQTQKGDK